MAKKNNTFHVPGPISFFLLIIGAVLIYTVVITWVNYSVFMAAFELQKTPSFSSTPQVTQEVTPTSSPLKY